MYIKCLKECVTFSATSSAADWPSLRASTKSAHKTKKFVQEIKKCRPSLTLCTTAFHKQRKHRTHMWHIQSLNVWQQSDHTSRTAYTPFPDLCSSDWHYLHAISIHPYVGLILADWAVHIIVTFLGSSCFELNILCSNTETWHLHWIEIKIQCQLCSVISIIINVTFYGAFYCDEIVIFWRWHHDGAADIENTVKNRNL